MAFTHEETPDPWTKLAAKGVRKSSSIQATVEDALGIDAERLPMTPSRLFAL